MNIWPKMAVGFVALATAYSCYWYSQWWERVTYLRWISSRQAELVNLGERIRTYATDRDGTLPQIWSAFIEAGVIAEREIDFQDQWECVHVTRILRPVPSITAPKELLLVVELYGVDRREGCVLRLSGHVDWESDLVRAVRRDNQLRAKSGLPEVALGIWE